MLIINKHFNFAVLELWLIQLQIDCVQFFYITVYDSPLLVGFNVAIKGLNLGLWTVDETTAILKTALDDHWYCGLRNYFFAGTGRYSLNSAGSSSSEYSLSEKYTRRMRQLAWTCHTTHKPTVTPFSPRPGDTRRPTGFVRVSLCVFINKIAFAGRYIRNQFQRIIVSWMLFGG